MAIPTEIVGSRRQLLKNSTGILISRVLTTLVAFISIPIIVGELGIEGYGTWESILAVSLLTNIFQGTMSGTLLWLVSNAFGLKDIDSVRQYIRMAVFVSLILFAVVAPTAWYGRYFLVHLFNVPPEFALIAAKILPCIVGLMLLSSIFEIFGSVISGFQRAGATTLTLAVAAIVNNVLVIICLIVGFGFWSLLVGFVSGFLISAVGLYFIAIRVAGSFSLLPLLPTRSVLIKVLPYAGFIFLGALSMALREQTDKIILSSVASPIWTGYYGIASRMAMLVPMICTFFYVPTIAASGALHSNRDLDGINSLYDDVMLATSFLVGLVVVLIAGMHDRLVLLWIGRAIPEIDLILYLMLISNTVAVLLTGTGSSICKGMGLIRAETIYIIIGLVLNIILKIFLVPLVGAIGTVIASSVSWTISSIVFVLLFHKQISLPFSTTLKAVKTLLIISVCVLVARGLTFVFPVEADRLSVLFSLVFLGLSLTMLFTLLMVFSKVLPLQVVHQSWLFFRTKISNGLTKS